MISYECLLLINMWKWQKPPFLHTVISSILYYMIWTKWTKWRNSMFYQNMDDKVLLYLYFSSASLLQGNSFAAAKPTSIFFNRCKVDFVLKNYLLLLQLQKLALHNARFQRKMHVCSSKCLIWSDRMFVSATLKLWQRLPMRKQKEVCIHHEAHNSRMHAWLC